MGTRQSKRSVDITTGKEVVVEGSEVAASGGEGKLERIEDLDNLKPQLNGDTGHLDEISDKEKKMKEQDEAPENEKDNCNEKEIILTPVTAVNGDSGEQQLVNNDEKAPETAVEAETNKKNKKEKVKKKWSFRSFSFNKKDKQKPTKKEEVTNGECDKVPEEAGDAAVAATEIPESKVEVEVVHSTEAPKAEDVEKTPETPVTEPMTNGSSVPESPKEETRHNGDSTSIEEQQPAPVEIPKEEVIEAAKPVQEPESLPINGLKIEDPIESVPEQIESKQEEIIPEKIVSEPVDVKMAETEVCVMKDNTGMVEIAEQAPPPLPANPPPSSLTIFAESTMAPHLVDKQIVDNLPVVDASVSSDLSPKLVSDNTENLQQTTLDESAPPVYESKEIDNVPLALPKEEVIADAIATDNINIDGIKTESVSASNVQEINTPLDINIPVESESAISSDVIETPAVVSSTETEPLVQNPSNDVPLNPSNEPVNENTLLPDKTLEIEKKVDNIEVKIGLSQSCPVESIPIVDSNSAIEISVKSVTNESESVISSMPNVPVDVSIVTDNDKLILDTNVANEICNIVAEIPVEKNILDALKNESDGLPPCINDPVLPINESESPLLQRTPSDPDISDTAFVEPSDSFPPPPPPVSCPESITEISVSESLPPPLSECSQPDAVLNSPISESIDFPPKDLPSPIKDDQQAGLKDVLVTEATKHESQALPSALPETATSTLPELESETTSNNIDTSSIEESQKKNSTVTSQVKSVAEVIAAVDNHISDDTIPSENCVVKAE